MGDFTIGERRYIRFDDEWDDPYEGDSPRWFTAVYLGESPRTVRRGDQSAVPAREAEGRWAVDGVPRWEYGTEELVIGDPAEAALAEPIPASRDRFARRP